MKTKICTKCKKEKSLDKFNRDTRYSKDGRQARCKICENVYERKRRKEFKKSHPEYATKKEWEYNLRGKYGITIEQWQQMFEVQQGYCSVCGKHQSELKRRLGVEHCHRTGRVRSLACPTCNHLIDIYETGFYGLREEIADYLERHNG